MKTPCPADADTLPTATVTDDAVPAVAPRLTNTPCCAETTRPDAVTLTLPGPSLRRLIPYPSADLTVPAAVIETAPRPECLTSTAWALSSFPLEPAAVTPARSTRTPPAPPDSSVSTNTALSVPPRPVTVPDARTETAPPPRWTSRRPDRPPVTVATETVSDVPEAPAPGASAQTPWWAPLTCPVAEIRSGRPALRVTRTPWPAEPVTLATETRTGPDDPGDASALTWIPRPPFTSPVAVNSTAPEARWSIQTASVPCLGSPLPVPPVHLAAPTLIRTEEPPV